MVFINGKASGNKDLQYYQTEDYEVYYTGFFFLPGFLNGIESLKELLSQIKKNGLDIVRELFGVYFINIRDVRNERSYVFIDNSGLFKAYLFDQTISTSFLELIESSESQFKLDKRALVEFLHFGFVHFDKTLCKGITKLEPQYIYSIGSEGGIEKIDKTISNISDRSKVDPESFFKVLHNSIREEKLSVDLTGGTDSRLIVSALCSQKADFELAISGMPGNRDIQIGQEISNKIGKEFYPYYHSVDDITADNLGYLFDITDGQVDIIVYQRIYNLQKSRLERDISVHLSGVGGELYKDFWWLQDFPRYHKKFANLSKLYRLRIESVEFDHSKLDKSLHALSKDLKKRTLKQLQSLILSTNSQTYDSIYYYYKMQTSAGYFLTIANRLFKSYAPLLELELVKSGFSLPRKQRFYNNFHREFITSSCKSISKIRTDTGTTCSSSLIIKIVDLFSYGIDLSIRLLKQILRKILKKTMLQESPNNKQLYPRVRNLDMIDEILMILKKHGILGKNVSKDQLNNNLLGKLITVGLFIKKYENKLIM